MNESPVQELRAKLRGELITPTDLTYETARKVYNAMIDRRAALIVRCRDAAVMAGVGFTREHGLLLAVRGGAHNGPGLGTCDGGLVLDLAPMRDVRVDPTSRTVRVSGGSVWGDVDHATHPFGLAVPSGFISTTGVGGLTLGGGVGYLTRRYGLTIDNLLEVDLVLADGRLVTPSPREHADLFWAVRGGGGNFGVVTSFSVPRQSSRHRLRRADLLAAPDGKGGPAFLARLHPERSGGPERLVRLRHRAPGPRCSLKSTTSRRCA